MLKIRPIILVFREFFLTKQYSCLLRIMYLMLNKGYSVTLIKFSLDLTNLFNRLAFEHNRFDIKYVIISKLMNKLTDYYDCLSDFNERIY
ncbi:hypothetical protein VCSRO90_2765 [Vibrio cholerae]|nr:hypothetical protein VCSRO90_2765 [Vibrio cholerae]